MPLQFLDIKNHEWVAKESRKSCHFSYNSRVEKIITLSEWNGSSPDNVTFPMLFCFIFIDNGSSLDNYPAPHNIGIFSAICTSKC